ncbi:erythromycin esterase family protein [Streptomyces sp. NPDC101132]|uniref:erythromycin esterase family protein n=1 Tax=Streptomyces sp. NPDC101132 TaxID=3366110 RepID=UPI00380C78F3
MAPEAVDAYVRRGTGDGAEVLAGLGSWTWRTQEVLALLEWMRAYNRGRPNDEQVGFVGIDPQQCGASLAALDAFLRGAAPNRVAGMHEALGVLAKAYPGSRPDPQRRLAHEAEELLEFLRELAPEAADVLRHARILAQAADLVTRERHHTDPGQTVFAARDRHMAGNLGRVLDDPSVKVALWAHNGHITKSRYDGAVPALGQHLSERYGDAYYALGLLFGAGSFRARRVWPGPWTRGPSAAVVTHRLGPARSTTLEARLAAAHPGNHLLDLRGAAADAPQAVHTWLDTRHWTRSFGAGAPLWTYRYNTIPVTPADEYDGLAYIAVATDSCPLPAPVTGR